MLVEAVQVLSSKVLYDLPRDTIRRRLAAIIRLSSVRLRSKRRYLRALDLSAATSLDFVDALLVALAEQTGENAVISYDRGLDRIPDIRRIEPDEHGGIR